MLILIPLIVAPLTFLALSSSKFTTGFLFREKVVATFVLWSITLVGITEAISPFHMINKQSLGISWTILASILTVRNRPKRLSHLPTFKLDNESRAMLAIVGVILAV